MNRDLLSEINERMPEFSKGQKLIGKYIVNNYDKAAFMTANKLGVAVGISESTVVRFAVELGYEGYPQLQRSLQELIRNRLTTIQRLKVTNDQIGEDILSKVLTMDMDKIRRTLDEVSREDFDCAVNALIEAKTIYILGIRSASALAKFMYFYFNHIFPDVRIVISHSNSDIFEEIFRVDEKDVLIGITFPRYSKRTISAIEFAKQRGAAVVAITDSETSPIASKADYTLLARSDMTSFVDSLVAPLSLINALIVAIGIKKSEEISTTFTELERIWDKFDVYEKTGGDTFHD